MTEPERPSNVNDPSSAQRVLQPLQGSVQQTTPPSSSLSQAGAGTSLFQALSQWGRSKKRFLDERDLVKKIGEGAPNFFLPGQIPLVPRPLFRSCPLTESLEQATGTTSGTTASGENVLQSSSLGNAAGTNVPDNSSVSLEVYVRCNVFRFSFVFYSWGSSVFFWLHHVAFSCLCFFPVSREPVLIFVLQAHDC